MVDRERDLSSTRSSPSTRAAAALEEEDGPDEGGGDAGGRSICRWGEGEAAWSACPGGTPCPGSGEVGGGAGGPGRRRRGGGN